MHQSVVELGTEICRDVADARGNRSFSFAAIWRRSRRADGLKIASAGTHPFSHWMDQLDHRGRALRHDRQGHATDRARQSHLRAACARRHSRSRRRRFDLMNQARYFLPHLYALSVNSPFWLGQNTGLKAYRQMIFERFPRTGIPDAFESLSEYEDYLNLLVATNCIDNAKKIWWDIRLHPFFDTIEFRICDAQSRVDDTIALAALMQAIVFKLHKLLRQNVSFRMLSAPLDRRESLARFALWHRRQIDRFRPQMRSGRARLAGRDARVYRDGNG